MTDIHSPEARSHNMAMIKGKNTKPEIMVRQYLFSQGFRFRIHVKRLPGTPDIVLHRYRTVILVHGCFWHGHEGCRYFVMPRTRTEWWNAKIGHNMERDKGVKEQLHAMGWNIVVVWECQLKPKVRQKTLEEIAALLRQSLPTAGNKVPRPYLPPIPEQYLVAEEGADYLPEAEV